VNAPVTHSALTHSALPVVRQRLGFALAVAGTALLTAVLTETRGSLALESILLLYLLLVVLDAVVGGILPAAAGAALSFVSVNWFFVPPFHTLAIENRDNLVSLAVFALVAISVSVTVDIAARQRVAGERARVEAELLARIASKPVADGSPESVLRRVQETFGFAGVALVDRLPGGDRVVAAVGTPLTGPITVDQSAGGTLHLLSDAPPLFAEDRRLLSSLAQAAARAAEGQELAQSAARAHELAEIDRLRSALLAAVGHDLRTPLAGVKAAVSSLRQDDIEWAPAERDELLATIEESADQLDDLVSNLLAMSRLQAGVLSVSLTDVPLDEVVARALLASHVTGVQVDVPDDLPPVRADSGLLERVVANLVANARRFAVTKPVSVRARRNGDTVELQVVDDGPGVAVEDHERMFAPFQRLGDKSTGAGVGLGLAIARGFTESMGGTLAPSTAAGGGLVMTVTLAAAR
jgi:K+-sensing histidine kinase KdpD